MRLSSFFEEKKAKGKKRKENAMKRIGT